jgi:hypothetical protein
MFADFPANCKLLFEGKTAFFNTLTLRGCMNRATLSPFVEALSQGRTCATTNVRITLLPPSSDAVITARLKPELFASRGIVSVNKKLLVAFMTVIVVCGFSLRISKLSAEGLSEDELNKLQAVGDYREHGLTSANSEHPLLMKALLTASVVVADKWNSVAALGGKAPIETEAALRFPSTVFGAFTALLIYLLASELFGAEVGLIAAALWAFDPMAIGFNRIAKEDTFLLFFFLLAVVFWIYGQRTAEKTNSTEAAEKYYWAAGAALGAMMASKYLPQLLTVPASYYFVFQGVPATRWRLGKIRLLKFYGLMGIVFLLLNPTILLPATWHQMGQFAGQKLVGHDGYEFMGVLYPHRLTDWFRGIPWYFYHLFLLVKLPVLTVIGFVIGLPLIFKRSIGDGRYLLLLWMVLWMMTFCIGGGKFTRYFTTILPLVLIVCALGVQLTSTWLSKQLVNGRLKVPLHVGLALILVAGSWYTLTKAAPHYRLYTNAFGGGHANAGYYFPHDEFYDSSMREIIFEIAKRAPVGAQVASESPSLTAYYAQRAGRNDLVAVLLSDPVALKKLREGDFLIDARGRRYFSNEAMLNELARSSTPAFRVSLGDVPSARVYVLDDNSLPILGASALGPRASRPQ